MIHILVFINLIISYIKKSKIFYLNYQVCFNLFFFIQRMYNLVGMYNIQYYNLLNSYSTFA